jgi:hypothetical protein
VPGPGQADRPAVAGEVNPPADGATGQDGRFPQPPSRPVQGGGSQAGARPIRASDGQKSALVRPYAVTGGRTQPRYQLQIEAMVAAAHYGARDLSVLAPECQAILGFCRDWRSVAEISAVLRLPLGVARVLVADMAVEGLVRVHQIDHDHGRPDLNLLERVLSGLRKL